MTDRNVTLDRSEWRHPGTMPLLEAHRPYEAFCLLDEPSGLYSIPGLLLKDAGMPDDVLARHYSPMGLANCWASPEFPPHLTWLLSGPGTGAWANSEVEHTLHQWSDEGIFRARQWQRLDLVEVAISSILEGFGLKVQWSGDRGDALAKARALKPPYTCIYCGGASWVDPSDQVAPPDYCHPEDHAA